MQNYWRPYGSAGGWLPKAFNQRGLSYVLPQGCRAPGLRLPQSFSLDFPDRKRAEYCFESTASEQRTHWVLQQTRWVPWKIRWVRFGTQIIGWEELTEFSPRSSVRAKKVTELGVWNRALRNRPRPVSDQSFTEPRQLPRNFSHCGFWEQPRGSPEMPQKLSWPPQK